MFFGFLIQLVKDLRPFLILCGSNSTHGELLLDLLEISPRSGGLQGSFVGFILRHLLLRDGSEGSRAFLDGLLGGFAFLLLDGGVWPLGLREGGNDALDSADG